MIPNGILIVSWNESGLYTYEIKHRHRSSYENESNTEFSFTLEVYHWKALSDSLFHDLLHGNEGHHLVSNLGKKQGRKKSTTGYIKTEDNWTQSQKSSEKYTPFLTGHFQ